MCLALAAGASGGCGGDDLQLVDGLFSEAEWAGIAALSPLPAVPPDPTNRYADDPAAAALGQMLYFDPGFSGAIVTGDDGENGGLGAAGEIGRASCRERVSIAAVGVSVSKKV